MTPRLWAESTGEMTLLGRWTFWKLCNVPLTKLSRNMPDTSNPNQWAIWIQPGVELNNKNNGGLNQRAGGLCLALAPFELGK